MKKYGAAVHGCGWVADEHINAYIADPRSQVVAVSSRREESARRAAAKAGLTDVKIYTNYDELIADPAVDVVSICTPNHLHPEETIKAARAGKHVMIEKPVALNLEDLKRMRDVVRETGVKTVVGFCLRWNPLFDCIKAIIEKGMIGEVFYTEVDYWHGIGRWYGGYDWVTKKSGGASSFLAAGCHGVDAARYLTGEEIVEVSAYTAPIKGDYEYPATIVAVCKFASGAVGKLSSSLDCKMPYRFNIDIMGDAGSIRDNLLWSTTHLPGQKFFAEIPTILPDSGDVSHHPFEGQISELIDAIESGKESRVNLEDAVRTHEVCIACDISAEQGAKPVQLPLIKD